MPPLQAATNQAQVAMVPTQPVCECLVNSPKDQFELVVPSVLVVSPEIVVPVGPEVKTDSAATVKVLEPYYFPDISLADRPIALMSASPIICSVFNSKSIALCFKNSDLTTAKFS
jgi:hypothetical protein